MLVRVDGAFVDGLFLALGQPRSSGTRNGCRNMQCGQSYQGKQLDDLATNIPRLRNSPRLGKAAQPPACRHLTTEKSL